MFGFFLFVNYLIFAFVVASYLAINWSDEYNRKLDFIGYFILAPLCLIGYVITKKLGPLIDKYLNFLMSLSKKD